MRVLQVINTLDIGGAEALLIDIVRGLARRGVTCDVWVLKRRGTRLEEELQSDGVRVVGLAESSVYTPAHVVPLIRHLRHELYDVIHVHLFPAQLWVAVTKSISRVGAPLVTTEHNTHNRRRKWYFRPLDRWMYRRYHHIICISEGARAALVRWVPEVGGRASVVPNGISLERFISADGYAKARVIESNAPLVVSVGRLEKQKAMDILIRAISLLDGVHLAIVGDGSQRPELTALIEKLGVGERVHLLGSRSDIPQLLKAADVYVQSSAWEGFGIAVVEAMAAGLPVVASRVPGLADVVGEAGFLVPPGDPEAIAEQVRKLVDDESLRRALSKRSAERARAFSIDGTVEGILTVYEQTVARYSGSVNST